jgi:beta-aspartyl-peptidase (threonine type)
MHVIAHGGAGSPPDEPASRQHVLDEAVARGREESAPLAAVCATVRVLESDTQFNAGVGGAVQSDGQIRTDAGLMTADGRVGAACSLPGVEHAVSAARVVLEETPHVLLSGEHAVALADSFGVETGVDLWSESTRERWEDADTPAGGPREQLTWLRDRFGDTDPGGRETDDDAGNGDAADDRLQQDDRDHDTVGAVACDGERVAAATSTGGRWLALAGRVGDVPQVGSGFYCSPAGGASATGAGEDIARYTLSRRAVQHLEAGVSAQTAAEMAMSEFGDRADGSAGVIVMDDDGDAGEAYNSDAMQTARGP